MSDTLNMPMVSIIIPCYNQGAFLYDAIGSVEKGRPEEYELIIVNDGSTDGETLQVLAELERKGYRIIHQSNGGVSAARNTGIREARAKYILPLDGDNKIEPDYYRRAIALMEQDAAIGVVYSDCFLYGQESGTRTVGAFETARLLTGNYIDACAVFRKKVWEDGGGYDERIPVALYEDWEFWLHALSAGWKFGYIPEPLFHYQVQQESMNAAGTDPEKRKRMVAYILDKYHDLFVPHISRIISDLHSFIAIWEREHKAFRQHIREEYEQHRNVAEDAYKAELVRLQEHFGAEREKLITDYERHIHNLEEAGKAALDNQQAAFHTEMQRLHEEQHRREVELHDRLVKQFEDTIAAETQKNQQLTQDLEVQKTYAAHLVSLLQQYEDRVKQMESTRTWRLRKQYYKFRSLFKSSGRKKRRRIPGLGFIKKLFFFTLGKGKIITRRFFKKIFRTLYIWLEEFPVRIVPVHEMNMSMLMGGGDIYHQWMARNFPREAEFRQYKKESEQFAYKPLVSIILPVYNPPVQFFRQTLNSVIGQIYENWELCIADDASTDKEVKAIIEEYAKKDFRIKVVYRTENGHISRASNSALELATGEFSLLLDHDDLLTQDCIYHVVKLLNAQPETDLVYSDEDKIDENGQHSVPHFKPQWCPDNFLSRNYFGHVVVCRTSILGEIGGFRVGFEGSQDYDMLLRFTEKTQRIAHIPRVLYHWRIHSASAARSEEAKPYAYHAAQKALTESLIRRGEEATVGFLAGFRGYSIRYKLQRPGKVSIIIPTKDNADVLQTCINSIYARSIWKDFEVIVISNNSTEKKLFELLAGYAKQYPGRFSWHEHNIPFNFSALMNFGNTKASGDYLLLLNNDTEVITPDWMEAMMEQAQRPSVGAVGVKLLYPNDTIQHAGVIIGLGGIAGHTFVAMHKDEAGYFNYIQSISNYSAVTAACLMVSREKYAEVNGFDPTFEVEYNDVDFCLRLVKAGYHNIYLPHVELYHYESLTRGHPHMSKESYDRHIRELNLFKDRWQEFIDDDPCYSPNLGRGVHDFGIAL